MADTIGTQTPATYFHEVRRMVQPAHREKPEKQAPHHRNEDDDKAAESAPAHPAEPPRDVYRPPNLRLHVIIQELALSTPALAKEASGRRRRTRREGRYARPEDMDLRLLPFTDTIRMAI